MCRELFLLTLLLAIAWRINGQGQGQGQVRVVGGRRSLLGEYPSLVALLRKNAGFFCGGDLITSQHVLTAAHCFLTGVQANELYIMAGDKHLSWKQAKTRKHLLVRKIISHPQYHPTDQNNDYAVLVLKQAVKQNKHVKTIKLAKERPAAGTKCTVTGWGFLEPGGTVSQEAMKADVFVSTTEKCHGSEGIDDASMFCAGVEQGGVDACTGDSGGPLFCNGELAGIVSWGINCALPQYPGVYADVAAQRDWIIQQISSSRSFRGKGKNASSAIMNPQVEAYILLILLTLSYPKSLKMLFIYCDQP